MNEQDDVPPMRPVHADDVRRPRKPWWAVAYSRGQALFLGVLYVVLASLSMMQGVVHGRWWDFAIGAAWLLLDGAAWVTVWWFSRHQSTPDGGAS